MVVPGARNHKTVRENHYFDGMNDRELRERYNSRRDAIKFITGLVGDILKRKTHKNHALSPRNQVLITLRYLTKGNFMQTVVDTLGFDKSTVSRVVNTFVDAICQLKKHFIQRPQSKDREKNIDDGFYLKRIPKHHRLHGRNIHTNPTTKSTEKCVHQQKTLSDCQCYGSL